MTFKDFFTDYLWPFQAMRVERKPVRPSRRRKRQELLAADAKDTGPDNGGALQATGANPSQGVQINLQLRLKSDVNTYVRRWLVVSVGAFAAAWFASIVLTTLAVVSGAVAFGLWMFQRSLNRRDDEATRGKPEGQGDRDA